MRICTGTTLQHRVSKRERTQRGSALLVVLVFAAIVAIMLYRELPVAAFEAQRQKEELLISRGSQYKRAVQLFVRKVGRFPTSLDELESTNRMRFLRHRYMDPLTGKEDWRIVHAGPGGVIIDSMVKETPGSKNSNALGQGAVFAGFNNSFSGDQTAAGDAEPTSAALRQRPAATKNATTSGTDSLGLPITSVDATTTDTSAAVAPTGLTPGGPVLNSSVPVGSQGVNSGGAQPYANQPAPGQNPPGGPNAFGANGGQPGGIGISSVADQLNNVNPKAAEQGPAQQTSAFGNTSVFGNPPTGQPGQPGSNVGNAAIGAAGGIAGVASKAKGTSIKTVNDQSKYKLWEFYYDLRKEQSGGAAGALGGAQNPNTNNGAGVNGAGANGGFGQSQPSTFGQNGAFGQKLQSGQSIGFDNPTPPPPPQQVPQQQ